MRSWDDQSVAGQIPLCCLSIHTCSFPCCKRMMHMNKHANAKSDECLEKSLMGTCTCILRRPTNEIAKPSNHMSMHERLKGFARGSKGLLERREELANG